MEAVNTGPVEAAAGSLTKIVTVVPGWETITNANAASVGVDRQSDQDYKNKYRVRTAHSSIGPITALKAALAEALATRVRVEDNRTSLPITIQQWVIQPHSILVIVEGGSDGDVTRAVENHRSMGSGTMAAILGGTPDNAALDQVNAGTITWDGVDYSPLDLTSSPTPEEKAVAVGALTVGTPAVTIPVSFHYEWPIGGYYVAIYHWMPGITAAFAQASVEESFGLDPQNSVQSPGPFVRARSRALVIDADVTRQPNFPSDGLTQIIRAVNARVSAYGIGEQVWLNDILCEIEAVGGTRVTSLTVQENGRDISGVAVPIDVTWTLAPADLTVTIT